MVTGVLCFVDYQTLSNVHLDDKRFQKVKSLKKSIFQS